MSVADDVRFWDRTSRQYATSAIADQAGYERTLDQTRALLKSDDRVLELGCGTGTTALRLAGDVQDYLATDISAGMIAVANEKHAASPIPALTFRIATVEALAPGRAVQRCSGIQLSSSGPRPAWNVVPHSRLARSGGLVHLQDTLRRGYEPTHPACVVARDARDRQSTLRRRLSGGGAEPAYMRRRLRHSCHRKPRNEGQRQAPLHRGSQEVTRTAEAAWNSSCPDFRREFEWCFGCLDQILPAGSRGAARGAPDRLQRRRSGAQFSVGEFEHDSVASDFDHLDRCGTMQFGFDR